MPEGLAKSHGEQLWGGLTGSGVCQPSTAPARMMGTLREEGPLVKVGTLTTGTWL